MRVVVVGATGNIGTAVLRRLHAETAVTSVIGIARRLPDDTVAPYAGVEWHSVDVAGETAVKDLAEVFRGADAVVHLAWALQPNHDERALWRVNVSGTAAVLAAVARAGVPHVLTASSIGAYSSAPKSRRVDESWPTGGIHTSHYSRHKAMNERALDSFEHRNPPVIVTRMRPGLVFQHDTATEQTHLFLGRHIPTRWLGVVRPPVLPVPPEFIFQAVHADDLADAFCRAVVRRAGGAFNIAAEPVLTPKLVANVLGAKRVVPLRLRVLRLLLSVTWKLRLQASDPGWVDLAGYCPVMDIHRARTELGWRPSKSSTEALADVVSGASVRARHAGSPPLDP
ncbi:NAD-dependent epimerase/dehydratase family protein [Microbacteriaceae bacterium 4G12]